MRLFNGQDQGRVNDRATGRRASRRRGERRRPDLEGLEPRALLSVTADSIANPPADPSTTLSAGDVQLLLARAAATTAGDNAIVAVVDRNGVPLGVRVEGNVSTAITGSTEKLVFAVDGALAEARTGAFFGNNQAPLTSRTIQEISQSTMTQREIQSDPNVPAPNSTLRGPGFVAPIGKKGHFPARVMFTPQVDLFEIEHTNRDSIVHPGPSHVKGIDDILLPARFNADPAYVPLGKSLPPPESYGFVSGILPNAQSRGIGTLPGGIPLFKNGALVGGIGVFFPGTTGFATEENSALNDDGFFDPTKRDLAEQAEYVAFVAAGGSAGAGVSTNTLKANTDLGLPPLPGFDLPFGRIDLVGITLDLFGGHGLQGPKNLVDFGRNLGAGDPNSGANLPVSRPGAPAPVATTVPDGWLVLPHASADGTLTAADVTGMIVNGIAQANQVRAAIRLPLDSTAKMVFAVTDKQGNILGLYRMPNATVFSIDVAVAKARNVAYYADPAQLQAIDQVKGLPKGVAMTNRTFRYLALPHFPEGIDTYPSGPFSILNEVGTRNFGPALPASAFQTVQGFDSFHPETNFHDPNNIANQNGIVFFPGSSPLYKPINGPQRQLVGGLGVSGDGVDQDDDVTFAAAKGFGPPSDVLRADNVHVRGVRLPYQKFNRQPHESLNQPKEPAEVFKTPVLPNGQKTGLSAADVRRLETARRIAIQAAPKP